MPLKQHVQIEGKELQLTNLEKVLWPKPEITKAQLIDYHSRIWPYTKHHWSRRPMTVTRYPHGITKDFFYQKNKPQYAPDWIQTFRDTNGTEYILVDDLPTLVWMLNQATIEFHPATFTVDAESEPSFAIIDLDPTHPAGFSEAVEVSLLVRQVLKQFQLQGYPKVSGATGVHIYVPIGPGYTFQDSCRFVEIIGKILVQFYPNLVTNERLIKNRKGVYVDHLQNLASKTIVGVYSPRPLSGAPISTPVLWEELPNVHPRDFSLVTIPDRVKESGDLFEPVLTHKQSIDHVLPIYEQLN